MNFIPTPKIVSFCLAVLGFIACDVCADVVISGTRIIYPAQAKEITVKLDNRGEKALLVQSWLDDGREDVNPQEMKIPFLVTPPYFTNERQTRPDSENCQPWGRITQR